MKTYQANRENTEKKWVLVDVEGKTLGRAATQIAAMLRGKTKATFTPHADAGEFVVVVNADKIKVTGNKLRDKFYHWYSGYPGGLASFSTLEMLKLRPTEVVRHAVSGMLPKTKLGKKMMKNLKIYATAEHPHTAQTPEKKEL